MTPYDRYCQLRDEKGVKDKNVADAIWVSRSTFSDWKSGRSVPKSAKMLRIAQYFGVSYPYIMCLTDERTLPKNVFDTTAITDMMFDSYIDAVERGDVELPEQKENDVRNSETDSEQMSNEDINNYMHIDYYVKTDNGSFILTPHINHTGDMHVVKEALDLYKKYQNASPEIQAAIETLLKTQSPKS